MAYGLVALDGKELGDLADEVYWQESHAIKSRTFANNHELNEYLEDCGTAYDYVAKILKAAGESNSKWKDDAIKGPIAHNMLDYVEKALNTGLQTVRNCSVRKSYLEKLSNHLDGYIAILNELNVHDSTKVNDLSEDVINFRDSMANYMENYNSKDSDRYSDWVKSQKITFPDLVKRHQAELGYKGSFKDLEDGPKLEIYERIIRLSGKGNVFKTDFKSKLGVGFLVVLAGMMVWDVYASKHKIEEAARKVVDYLTYVGTALLKDVVQGIVKTLLIDEIAIEIAIAEVIAWGAGALSGFVGAFIIGAFAGPLLDLFFHSGGILLSTEGIRCHSAEMPDGVSMANKIWNQDHPANP